MQRESRIHLCAKIGVDFLDIMDDAASAGEIGQVGKSTYLHGFTAAVGILREDIDMEEQNL